MNYKTLSDFKSSYLTAWEAIQSLPEGHVFTLYFPSKNQATNFRHMMHRCRAVMRREAPELARGIEQVSFTCRAEPDGRWVVTTEKQDWEKQIYDMLKKEGV